MITNFRIYFPLNCDTDLSNRHGDLLESVKRWGNLCEAAKDLNLSGNAKIVVQHSSGQTKIISGSIGQYDEDSIDELVEALENWDGFEFCLDEDKIVVNRDDFFYAPPHESENPDGIPKEFCQFKVDLTDKVEVNAFFLAAVGALNLWSFSYDFRPNSPDVELARKLRSTAKGK